jgi:hypothetical protein
MDLATFYATVSATGFTLLGLWWVVVDKHPEWFEDRVSARMAYVVSLHFIIPAASSLLSLVAPEKTIVWRVVFLATGLSGVVGAALVARSREVAGRSLGTTAMVLALPVYACVVLVAAVPAVSDLVSLKPLQVEGFLTSLILVLGLHAVWFFSHQHQPAKAATSRE